MRMPSRLRGSQPSSGRTADCSERIANSERYLDMAKANNQRAEDKAAELKQLNKSIFRPVVTWNKVSCSKPSFSCPMGGFPEPGTSLYPSLLLVLETFALRWSQIASSPS